MTEHVVAKKIYYTVFSALLVLLAMTIGAAYVQLGGLNVVAAFSIASIKAALIILYFMHVRYISHLIWIFVLAGFFWLGILFVLTWTDYISRGL